MSDIAIYESMAVPAPPATAPIQPIEFEPGIYFGLDEEAYHAIPALSSSGIRDLLISPLDYWTNSRLNPDYEDKKTSAMIDGTAFHRRLLEPERFFKLYAGKPTKADFPDAIDGGDALKAECERLGLKKSGKIADLCERILEAEPRSKLWPVIEDGLLQELEGRILLTPSTMKDIERTARIVFAHTSAAKALTGGYAEVSILWVDEESGVPMKARCDYLKTRAIIDLKTFSNSLGRPIDAAVASAAANGRYGVQAVIYDDAVSQAKQMLRKHKSSAIHNMTGIEIDPDWIVSFASCEQHAFAFLFIEQGPVTNVRLREFRRTDGAKGATTNMYWQAGYDGYRLGVLRYYQCMKEFGPDKPWIEDEPMKAFADQDFPMWLFG
jgi:hypothetical protein